MAIDPNVIALLQPYTWRKHGGHGDHAINGLLRVEQIGDPEIQRSGDIDSETLALSLTLATLQVVLLQLTQHQMRL